MNIVLNSPDGWFQMHRETGIFDEDSGLIVISSKEAALSAIAAAAYVAMRFCLRSETEESRFSTAVLLIPPGQRADALRDATLTAIQAKMKEVGMSELMIKLIPRICETRSVVTLVGSRLMEVVSELPPHSACIVYFPELYRVEGVGGLPPPDQPGRAREIARGHLDHLLQELAATAQQKKMILVLLCNKSRTKTGDISPPKGISFIAIDSINADPPEFKGFEMGALVEAFRSGGWPQVKSHSGYDQVCENQIAFALFDAFGMERNLPLAWAAMEPYLDHAPDLTAGSQLCLSAAALVAGNIKASLELLKQAVKAEIETAEDLFEAVQLAYSLDEPEVFEGLVAQMQKSLPGNPLTQQAEYLRLFKQRNFSAALKIAEQLNLPTDMAHCRAFDSPTIDAAGFLMEMEKRGELEQGLMSCAEEARFREDFQSAIVWAQKIPESHHLFERACIVRFQATRIGFRKGEHGLCTEELESLMRIVAASPSHIALRAELERLLDFCLEEPLVKVVLSAIVAKLIERRARLDEESIERARSLEAEKDNGAGGQTEEEFQEFCKEFVESQIEAPGNKIHLGQGKLDARLLKFVGPVLIRRMAEEVLDHGLRENLEFAAICLHVICLSCNEAGDPSTDFAVLQSTIAYQASMGSAQQARDLAETALQFWPQSQPEFLEWRISQGWAALAEACFRSGNILAALRYHCLSLLAHEAPAPDFELLRRSYRMAARIFRTLGLAPYAFRCIALERGLLDRVNNTGQAVSLDVLELQICLPGLLSSPEEVRFRALNRSEELIRMGVESEMYPLAGIQANILRLVPAAKVHPDILKGFRERVDAIPEPLRSTLRATSNHAPTMEDIAAIIEALPEAQDHNYLAYQISSSLPALSNALRHAVESGDKDLYFLAAGAFAQPSLGVQTAESPPQEKAPSETSSFLRTTTLEGLKSGTFEQVPQFSFGRLASISIAQLQGVLGDSEVALIIANEPAAQPCGLLVSRDSVSEPWVITSWSLEAFAIWKATFKEKFYWEKPAGFMPGIDPLTPPIPDIKGVVEDLAIGLGELPKQLTIVPASHLFGFTWQLSPHADGFLAGCEGLAVAPSAAWLVAARTSPWSGSSLRKAWIGSAESTDNTLIVLRQYLGECLSGRGFETSNKAGPFDFAGSELAFIGAHGGTGIADYFRSVSDRVNHFSPTELAQMLAGCGCVILAVCSGGRSDRQTGSEEALGLVTSLFRVGVRCVIAPPWPLDVEVMKYWLPAFLEAMDAGKTAGEAAQNAREAVRSELDHPCAWGQMHLYGDQNLRLHSSELGAAESPDPQRAYK